MTDDLLEFWGLPSDARVHIREEMLEIHRKSVRGKIRAGQIHVGESCRTCMKSSDQGFPVCQRCMHAPYCSRECQKLDWPQHKLTCARIPVSFQETVYVLFGNSVFQDVLRLAFIHRFKLLEKKVPKFSKSYNSEDKRPSAPLPMILEFDLVFQATSPSADGGPLPPPNSGKVKVVPQLRNTYFPPPRPIPFERHEQCLELLARSCKQTDDRNPTYLNGQPDSVAFVGLIYIHLASESQVKTIPLPILKSSLDEYEVGLGGTTMCIIITDDVPQTCSASDSEEFLNRIVREDHHDKFSLRRKFSYEAFQELDAAQTKNYSKRAAEISKDFKESEKEMKMQLLGCGWSQRSFTQ